MCKAVIQYQDSEGSGRRSSGSSCKRWRNTLSPPGTPPSELAELGGRSGTTAGATPMLPERFHFFICHHQGSGGNQAHLLSTWLQNLGYLVWHDNSQRAEQRNLDEMKRGVRASECLLIFLSGRKKRRASQIRQATTRVHSRSGSATRRWPLLVRWGCALLVYKRKTIATASLMGRWRSRAPAAAAGRRGP